MDRGRNSQTPRGLPGRGTAQREGAGEGRRPQGPRGRGPLILALLALGACNSPPPGPRAAGEKPSAILEFEYTPRSAVPTERSARSAARVFEDDAQELAKLEGAKPLGRALVRVHADADQARVVDLLSVSAAKRGGTHFFLAPVRTEVRETTQVDQTATTLSAIGSALSEQGLDMQCQSGNARACFKPAQPAKVYTTTTLHRETIMVLFVYYVPSVHWPKLPSQLRPEGL